MFLAGKAAWAGIVFILPPLVPSRSQLLDHVPFVLAFRQSYTGGMAPDLPADVSKQQVARLMQRAT
jgi:hypothetical protein